MILCAIAWKKERKISIWFEICWAKCRKSPHPEISNDINMLLCSKGALKLPNACPIWVFRSALGQQFSLLLPKQRVRGLAMSKRNSAHKPISRTIVEFGSSNNGNTLFFPIVKPVCQNMTSGFMLFPHMSVPGMCSGGKSKRWAR